jgi:HPt (histidine-containing phosphotransfer) domain-containing protein
MKNRGELDALLAEYRRDVPKKIERLQELSSNGRLPELLRELHTLAGSAGTFGLPGLGAAARAAETHLISCGTHLDDVQRAELDRLLGILRHEACTV